jgi:hypothetical protein
MKRGVQNLFASSNGEIFAVQRDIFVTGEAVQTAAGQNILLATAGTGAFDSLGSEYAARSAYLQIVPTGTVSSGVVSFEGSNDGTTFVPLPLFDAASLGSAPVTSYNPATGTSRFFEGKVRYRYFRARISTIIGGGGSLQCLSRFSQSDYVPTNPQENVAQINGVTPLMGNGVSGTGSARVTLASDCTQPTTLGTPNLTNNILNSAATTNATSVKASAGSVFTIVATNINAAARFLKLYNKASAPTVGTDVPVVTLSIPASGVPLVVDSSLGIRFTTGIAYAITGAAADTDTTAVAAGEIKVSISYF